MGGSILLMHSPHCYIMWVYGPNVSVDTVQTDNAVVASGNCGGWFSPSHFAAWSHIAIVYLAGGVSNIWLPSLPGGGSGLGKLHAEASHGHLLHNINSNNADGNPPKIPGNFTINDWLTDKTTKPCLLACNMISEHHGRMWYIKKQVYTNKKVTYPMT